MGNKNTNVEKRFQDCSKIIKLWRYLWYLGIPFMFLYHKVKSLKIYEDKEVDGKIIHTNEHFNASTKLIWRLCLSDAHVKMKWYYKKKLKELKKRDPFIYK